MGWGKAGAAPVVTIRLPVWVAHCEPTQRAHILPRGLSCSVSPPLVQENQFFSPRSTYPKSFVHILIVTGKCPIYILMPNPSHVCSHIHIPTILICISVCLRNLIPTPDLSPHQNQSHYSCFMGQGLGGGRPIHSALWLEEADLGNGGKSPPFVVTPRFSYTTGSLPCFPRPSSTLCCGTPLCLWASHPHCPGLCILEVPGRSVSQAHEPQFSLHPTCSSPSPSSPWWKRGEAGRQEGRRLGEFTWRLHLKMQICIIRLLASQVQLIRVAELNPGGQPDLLDSSCTQPGTALCPGR